MKFGSKKIAFTTDSYVVNPIFFPGGDIGSLAVCGTVNDLAVCGARPLYLSLALIIEEGLDKNILEKIAIQHKKGRRLFIGTANLDAERFVIWDMGAIACRGDTELFRKVILASAAIPIVFPRLTIFAHPVSRGILSKALQWFFEKRGEPN